MFGLDVIGKVPRIVQQFPAPCAAACGLASGEPASARPWRGPLGSHRVCTVIEDGERALWLQISYGCPHSARRAGSFHGSLPPSAQRLVELDDGEDLIQAKLRQRELAGV